MSLQIQAESGSPSLMQQLKSKILNNTRHFPGRILTLVLTGSDSWVASKRADPFPVAVLSFAWQF
jgi:hypothetical protein